MLRIGVEITSVFLTLSYYTRHLCKANFAILSSRWPIDSTSHVCQLVNSFCTSRLELA